MKAGRWKGADRTSEQGEINLIFYPGFCLWCNTCNFYFLLCGILASQDDVLLFCTIFFLL